MTTIAYDHKNKECSVDGRTTAGNSIISENMEKYKRIGNYVILSCGFVDTIQTIHEELESISIFNKNDIRELELEKLAYKSKNDSHLHSIILCDNGKVYSIVIYFGNCTSIIELDYNECAGSGGDYATTALHLGYDSRESIKIASQLDNGTGGKIKTFKYNKVKKMWK